MAQHQISPQQAARMVDYIEVSSVLTEKAAAAEAKLTAMEKQAEQIIPGLVETLATIRVPAENGHGLVPLLDETEKRACVEALRDPVRALQIFSNMAATVKKAQTAPPADRIGQEQPTRQKAAGVDSPYTGRRTSEQPASYQNFQNAILGR